MDPYFWCNTAKSWEDDFMVTSELSVDKKPRKIRFISGRPELVDGQVNELLDEYAVVAVNYATTADGVIVTCYLVHKSEVRMAQLAGAGPMPARRN
jgi:hypothetical protein